MRYFLCVCACVYVGVFKLHCLAHEKVFFSNLIFPSCFSSFFFPDLFKSCPMGVCVYVCVHVTLIFYEGTVSVSSEQSRFACVFCFSEI